MIVFHTGSCFDGKYLGSRSNEMVDDHELTAWGSFKVYARKFKLVVHGIFIIDKFFINSIYTIQHSSAMQLMLYHVLIT